MNPPPASSNLIGFFVHAVYRHRWRMLLAFAISLGVVGVATALSARIYRSQAKLYVRLGRENATLDPTVTLGQNPVIAVPPSRENELNSFLDILGSRVLLDRVIDKLGAAVIQGKQAPGGSPPETPPEPLERAKLLQEMNRKLDVEVVKRSNILVLSYQSARAENAQAVVSCLVDAFLDQHVRLHRSQGAYRFLAEQYERVQKDLAGTEERLRQFKEKTGLIAVESQKQQMVSRAGRLQDELLQAEAALAAGEAEIELVRQRLVKLPATQVTGTTRGLPNQALDTMRSQLYALELKQLELAGKYPENHPEVRTVRRQAEAARKLVEAEDKEREQVTQGPNRVHEEGQITLLRQEPQMRATRTRVELLHRQLDGERQALAELNRNEVQLSRLQRAYDLELAQQRRYAESLEQLQIDQSLQTEKISNISIVQPATLEPIPVKPRWTTNLALGVFFALGASLSLAVLLESADRALKTPQQAAATLPAPLLATIPRLAGKVSPVSAPLQQAARHALSLVVWPEPSADRGRVLGVVGAERGVGASTVAASLAAAALQTLGEPILLIRFGSPGSSSSDPLPGWHDLLAGECDPQSAPTADPLPGLFVLTLAGQGGAKARSAGAAEGTARFDRWRQHFAGIIVDLPDDAPAALRRGLAATLDSVIVVVAEGFSTAATASRRLEEWTAQGAPAPGVIVNRHRPLPRWLASLAGEGS